MNPSQPSNGAERASEFVAVQGGGTTTSAEAMLVTAYVLMWVAVFLFVWSTARRQKRLEVRLVELERSLERHERSS